MNLLHLPCVVAWSLAFKGESWRFGPAIAVLDDLDGDGLGELAIGEPLGERGDPGRVWLVSPVSEEVFWCWVGEEGLGEELVSLGDVDGDRCGDLLVGGNLNVEAELVVLSGSGGEPLARFVRPPAWPSEGPTIAALPDIDGDRRSDCAAVSRDGVRALSACTGQLLWHRALDIEARCVTVLEDQDHPEESRLLVRDDDICRLLAAVDGSEIALPWPTDIGWFESTCSAGDLDADGLNDLVLVTQYPSSRLVALSGCTLEELGSFSSGLKLEEYLVLSHVGDLDLDGRSEIVLGAHASGVAEGSIHLFEMPGGNCVFRSGPAGDRHDHWHFGATTAPLGDLDGDGVIDLVVGEDHRWSHQPGLVNLVSGKDGRILREIRRPDLRE